MPGNERSNAMLTSRTAHGIRRWSFCGIVLLFLSAPTAWAELPGGLDSWADRNHFPEAYSILTSDRVMFPDDISDWPVAIDSTHQLFVDDFLIGEIKDLTREFHQPAKHPENPFLPGGYAGVLYDEVDGKFRMWNNRELFTSSDGVHWDAPDLGPDGNLLIKDDGQLRGFMYNPDVPETEGRYKAVLERRYNPDKDEPGGFYLYHSRDGLSWEQRPERPILQRTINNMKPTEFQPMGVGSASEFAWTGTDRFQSSGVGDTSTFRYDTVLKRYVFDGKFNLYFTPEKIEELGIVIDHKPRLRLRTFSESEDLIHWSPPRFMMYPDRLDPADRQIYAHVGFVYESMWIGIIQTMQYQVTGWKQTDLHLSYSRDGRHWSRPGKRRPFIPLGPADSWDADYSVPPYTAPVLVNEVLFFYYAGSRNPAREQNPGGPWPLHLGLATLRRDGFASLNAGNTPGQVITRPLQFRGKSLFVNADVGEDGWVKAAILTQDSEPVPGYTIEDAVPLTQNTTKGRISWNSKEELVLADASHLRVLLQLQNANLYSFWIE
jgi:hypothetical protein